MADVDNTRHLRKPNCSGGFYDNQILGLDIEQSFERV